MPVERMDAMVMELNARKGARKTISRRRAFEPEKDDRFFSPHTREIKANLERGTALPEH